MIRKGYLKALRKGPARSLVVLDDEEYRSVKTQIPVIGRVAAGLPVLAVENRIGTVTLDGAFLRRGDPSRSWCKGVDARCRYPAG